MKNSILLILLFITLSGYGQDICMEVQNYYILDKEMKPDHFCSLVYKIHNVSTDSIVIMFTEDDVTSIPLKRLIYRKMFRRYGDFTLSQFIWDNVKNHSDYAFIPDLFIKILPPNTSFNMVVSLFNKNYNLVDSIFRNHILSCSLGEIDCNEHFRGFKNAVYRNHLEYSFSSITLLWEHIIKWLRLPDNEGEIKIKGDQ